MVCRMMRVVVIVGLVLGGLKLVSQPPAQGAQAKNGFVPTRFTVVDAGTPGKPDVVMIPGLSSSRAVWDAEAAKLAPNFRLHLVQVNGFAGQPAGLNAGSTNLLPAIVDELHGYIAANGMRPAVVGHSMGGLLTLMLAAKYPADVNRIVIVDTLPFYAMVFNPEATAESIKPMMDGMRAQMTGMSGEEWAAMQPMLASQMVKDPVAQKLVAANSASSDRAVVTEAMMEDLGTDVRGDLPTIKAPALVLYEHDGTGQLPGGNGDYGATVQASYKGMPNVKLVQVDGSRHFIMYDQPAKLDAAVEAFLR
jgi:pimeloyl-ACP methyl ester carboxylesterase